MKKRYSITFLQDGISRAFTPEEQVRESGSRWQDLLKDLHGDAWGKCGCPGSGQKALTIRHTTSTGYYSPVKKPLTGAEHAPDCVFHSVINDFSKAVYGGTVIRENDDGTVNVVLAVGLRQREPSANCDAPVRPPRPALIAGGGQPDMKLAGLLHLLWDMSSLNRWYPWFAGKRFTGSVHGWLRAQSDNILVWGTRLSDVLLAGAVKDSEQALANRETVKSVIRERQRPVIITRLRKWRKEDASFITGALPVRDFWGLPEMLISRGRFNRLAVHYPREFAAWQRGDDVVVIVLAETPAWDVASRNYRTRVLRIALMAVSKEWVPFESSYEKRVEEALRSQKRSFIKPLRYDAREEDTFPDFLLTDTRSSRPVPMEVFGMATLEYIVRREEKKNYYNRNYTPAGWWYWSPPESGEDMPPFPSR